MTRSPAAASLAMLRARDGLASTANALVQRACRIGYLGASVTAQHPGYVEALHRSLVRLTGQAHTAALAALGGVGSVAGAYLMDFFLRDRMPDLCFVEFTTTDVAGYSPPPEIGPAVEGIVRGLLGAGCRPVLVHLMRRDTMVSDAHPAVADYEAVATHYGVPSLHLAEALAVERTPVSAFLRDAVHTNAEGAAWLALRISEAVGTLLAHDTGSHATRLPTPLHAARYDETRMTPATACAVEAPDTVRPARFRQALEYLVLGVGNSISVDVDGVLSGALVVVGPDSGVVELVDPIGSSRYVLFDEYCHYDRLSVVIFDRHYPQPVRASLRLLADAVDYSMCRRPLVAAEAVSKQLRIAAFLSYPGPH